MEVGEGEEVVVAHMSVLRTSDGGQWVERALYADKWLIAWLWLACFRMR